MAWSLFVANPIGGLVLAVMAIIHHQVVIHVVDHHLVVQHHQLVVKLNFNEISLMSMFSYSGRDHQ